MRILVTGGAGFVGSHVVDEYVREGHEVHVLDSGRSGHNLPYHHGFWPYDINSGAVEEVFQHGDFDVINHHAANPSIPISITHPNEDADINIRGTVNLLELAKEYGVKQFIFASSSEVYGPLPGHEMAPMKPMSPYAIGKMAAEEYVRWFGQRYEMKTTIFRYANIYGPRQTPDQGAVIPKFIHNLTHGIPVTLNGGGVATRDFVYVEDVAQANLLALGQEGTFNIGSGKLVSIKELLGLIEEEVGVSGETRVGTRPTDFAASALDITHANEVLGWRPHIRLAEGLEKTVAAQVAVAA